LLAAETGAPVRVDRLDLRADASSVQILDAAVRWAQQVATIRGQIARENQSVVVDIELDSPGIQGNALLQRGEQAPPLPRRAAFFSWMRTMAVRGRIRLRSDFVEFDHVRLAPVAATVTLKK